METNVSILVKIYAFLAMAFKSQNNLVASVIGLSVVVTKMVAIADEGLESSTTPEITLPAGIVLISPIPQGYNQGLAVCILAT